ncbi:hypothetical protein, partial [Okeania sp. KiyG1]|uniref:hypothetical protein n=1 Tax=Okeania sp. KiyG1 TaxID=2720165 RepID=UPI001F38C675
LLQIARVFLRSQPTPRPSPSQPTLTPTVEGGEEGSQVRMNGFNQVAFSPGLLRKPIGRNDGNTFY